MSEPGDSYKKVPYDLRPAKQVERRMMLDAFQRLSRHGFDVSEYQYTGMGSVHFVDYVLFHKLLGIERMWSAENNEDIRRRVRFNKPYNFIQIKHDDIGDVIPTLSPDLKHILWLDYDKVISRDLLSDVELAASHLAVGSILIVTVDSEPPGLIPGEPRIWKRYFERNAGPLLGITTLKAFKKSNLPNLNVSILGRTIEAGLLGRDARFLPIFSFSYKDSNEMVTVGGVIGTNLEERNVTASGVVDQIYSTKSFEEAPYRITVPVLTRKERLYLDAAMPCGSTWSPREFEMPPELIQAYREVYRFFPSFAELLV
jgi:hypothetical protein